jgi:hypothetical protein
MGVELTSIGLPVVVAGEAWIRNKSITMDARTPAEYFALLDRLPLAQPLSGDRLERARRYAYHFFFRRMIPLGFLEPRSRYPIYRLRVRRMNELQSGVDRGLDAICAGILFAEPFVYDEHDQDNDPSGAVAIDEVVHADHGVVQ